MVNHKNLFNKHDHFFLWPYLHEACSVSNVLEKVVDLTNLNILKTTSYVNQFFALILQDVRFSFGCTKYCAGFSKFLLMKRLKITLKGRKFQLLRIFRCQDIPKNGLHSEILSFTRIIYLNRGLSSSRAICKFNLQVIQNVWHRQGLVIHITVYNSTSFSNVS